MAVKENTWKSFGKTASMSEISTYSVRDKRKPDKFYHLYISTVYT